MGRWGVAVGLLVLSGCMQAVGANERETWLQRIAIQEWNSRQDLPRCDADCAAGVMGLDVVHTDTAGMFLICGAGRNGCYNSRQYYAFNTDFFDSDDEYQVDKDWVVLHETVHALGDYSGLGDSDGNHSDVDRRWGMWGGTVLYRAYARAASLSIGGR